MSKQFGIVTNKILYAGDIVVLERDDKLGNIVRIMESSDVEELFGLKAEEFSRFMMNKDLG